jgi:hypothetical protein
MQRHCDSHAQILTAMPANSSTKTPDAPPDKPVERKFDRFRPDMPQIPGVNQGSHQAGRGLAGIEAQRLLQIGGIAGAVVLIGAVIFWWVKSKPRVAANSSSPDPAIAEQAAPSPPLTAPVAAAHQGPIVAATIDELSKPWDAKKFTFVNVLTLDNIDAMVIRLPGGGLWAFSLQLPFGRCELEYVTDLGKLASQFRYNASHPMVVSPCESTVYDPLKVGPLGGTTWARGEIVQGSSLRPPISIDVKVTGHSIIADGIE